ncbi:hypothetical protein H7K45_13220 [Mycobacterium yunnanensis]|uniref:Uncharacterized protein n=1 Tax=Mycobacterium yunnanensis TaxID=368477 RepID=A0A9X2Z425_9MYCO|nr:hypothetical protein [Mycobacterium yunnanensis]MCV7421502.1 hypothetical protein [Mycobacterium yunnanensis]
MTIDFRICAIAVAMLFALLGLGAGTATADSYAGQTYGDAAGKLSAKGYTPVISTVVGDQLSTNDCIVTSSRKPTYVRTDNFDHGKDYLLSLNCSAKLAHPGQPGNSLASPQGRKEKGVEDRAAKYNAKPENCAKNLDSCKKFCDKYEGQCSAEVLALF